MENLVYAIPLIVVLAINIPVWVLVAKKCRKRNEFKKLLRRGAVHVDYKPEFIAELMFSVDHQRRLFRPELFTDCAVIPFSKIRSVQLKYDVHVDVDVIRPGSTIRTSIALPEHAPNIAPSVPINAPPIKVRKVQTLSDQNHGK